MLYLILSLLVIPLTTTIFLSRKDNIRIGYISFALYCSTMILNGFFYIFKKQSLFNLLDHSIKFYMLYIVGSILLCWALHKLWKYLQPRTIRIFKYSTLLIILLFTNFIIYFLWFLDNSGRMTFDLFYFNLTTPVNTSVSDFYINISILLGIMIVMSLCAGYTILKSGLFTPLRLRPWKTNKLPISISILCSTTCLVFTAYLPIYAFHLEDAYTYFTSDSEFIKNNYVFPKSVSLEWPEKKRNLVLIFSESFESSFFSKELGGMLDENLLPNLAELMSVGVNFSDKENAFGGAISMPQATNTISGMASTLSGVNFKLPPERFDGDMATIVPGSINLGDLLAEQGYSLYFTMGAIAADYSIGPYYRYHGGTLVEDYEQKLANGDLPAGYKVWWGFEDSKLFQFAREDLTELGAKQEPFMYTLGTADVHNPGGYTDPVCSTQYDESMKNAIACHDYQLSELLKWMMDQPFYENTTVVVVGDHIAHTDKFIDSLKPDSDRRIFNLILNSKSPEYNDMNNVRSYWSGDMFPTMLSAMGVKIPGNRLGLGTNLFSNEPTLMEIYGEDEMRMSLGLNSDFYYEILSKIPE